MNAALRQFCIDRLGFDPALLSAIDLQARLPEITQALNAELQATIAIAKELQGMPREILEGTGPK